MTDSRYLFTESWLEIFSSQNPKAWTVSWPKSISLGFWVKASKKNKGLPWGVIWKPWFWLVGMGIYSEKALGGDCYSVAVRRLRFCCCCWNCLDVFPAAQGNRIFSHQRHALCRHVGFGMGENNGRISGSHNTWKKMEICSEDLGSPPQEPAQPSSVSTANQLSLGQVPSSWLNGARRFIAFACATWMQMFLSHSGCLTWCRYRSSPSWTSCFGGSRNTLSEWYLVLPVLSLAPAGVTTTLRLHPRKLPMTM